MLHHERKRKNKENANFVHIVYLLAKFCKIFDEAFFIDISIKQKRFDLKVSFFLSRLYDITAYIELTKQQLMDHSYRMSDYNLTER